MLELLLRSSGLDAFSASDQDEAIRLMEKEKVDLYIFDSLPSGQPNVGLCEYVRGRYPEAPIIIYSGRTREEDREAGFKAGATDYITKPHLEPLLAAVLQHISK
jgi:DNA-binding response OmpR family regulator